MTVTICRNFSETKGLPEMVGIGDLGGEATFISDMSSLSRGQGGGQFSTHMAGRPATLSTLKTPTGTHFSG